MKKVFFSETPLGSLMQRICKNVKGPYERLNSIGIGNLALKALIDSSRMRCKRESEKRNMSRPKKRLVFLIGRRKMMMDARMTP